MRTLPLAALVAVALLSTPLPAVAAPFDGLWSVEVAVTSGNCESGYLLPISVTNGRVSYAGRIKTTATGVIGASGRVAVRFVHNGDVVDARGQVRGDAGSGTWTSTTLKCTGRWRARRG